MRKKIVPKTTNNITLGIVNFLLNRGHSASRINTQGQYVEGDEHSEGGWRRSGSRKGYYDISVCLKTRSGIGLFHAIEVKFGKDRIRKDQRAFKREVEAAGGITFEAKDLQHYEDWYNTFLKPNYIDKL